MTAARRGRDEPQEVVAADLAAEGAVERIAAATDGLDVGLLACCAGADPRYERFLAQPVGHALAIVRRDCAGPVERCHRYAGPMADRGCDGIVLVGSGGGLVGAPIMVAYAASKAFDMVLAEALWAELHDRGVDVLGLILGVTDTPALRRLLARRGVLADEHGDPIPGAVPAAEVAEETLAHLADGPTWFAGDLLRDGARQLGALPRNDAVRRGAGVSAHAGIAAVLVRYATGIDRRDWDLFRTCFTDACEAGYGDVGTWHGVEEITGWMRATHEPCGPTPHRITNVAVGPTWTPS